MERTGDVLGRRVSISALSFGSRVDTYRLAVNGVADDTMVEHECALVWTPSTESSQSAERGMRLLLNIHLLCRIVATTRNMVDSQLRVAILDSSTRSPLTTDDEVTLLRDVEPRPLCLRRRHLVRREFDGRIGLGPVCRAALATLSDHLTGGKALVGVDELLELAALARV